MPSSYNRKTFPQHIRVTFPSPFSEIPSVAVEGTVDELAAEMAEPAKRDDLNLNLRAR